MKLFTRQKKQNSPSVISKLNRGFTLAEMLMVVAIFAILTTVVMFQYGNFNSQTIMTNTAYEVALATRQAQVYSLGVRNEIGSDNFDNRYGVYVDKVVDPEGKNFIFFIDTGTEGSPEDANSICDDENINPDGEGNCFACLSDGECLEKFTITRDIYIDRICADSDNTPYTGTEGACDNVEDIDALTITFERPNPDAIIVDPTTSETYTSAAVILKTSYGDQRAVVIKSTGQISVETLDDAS